MYTHFFLIFFGACIVNNIVLMRFFSLCSFFGVSDELTPSVGMGLAVLFVMVMANAITWPLYHFFLDPQSSVFRYCVHQQLDLRFLRTIVFVLIIVSLVQCTAIVMRKMFPVFHKAPGMFVPLITTNCVILGVALLSIEYHYTFIESIVYAVGVSCGYIVVSVLFAGIRQKIAHAPIPHALRGYPVALFTAGVMSLAFLGFKGLFGL